ncbi:MAG: hypothetical protein A3F74_06910 [Betaproteobacteria bacterium RIFCSPLOWO2_12_FULL_62_58]|nr:MAG: hypothetical protein A3F74_06910 [Betaproteobacteria bacterium RIFCSPLOWO2_12_FULL_62_58]
MKRLPFLRGLLRKFAFRWRITEYLETLQPAEESVIRRRKMAMYRIKRNTIKLAQKSGVVLSRPYASWNSEAKHIQSPSIEESHFHELVLEDGKRTTGRFSDIWLVRFVDGEQYAMKAANEMQRMVSKASKR